MTMLDEPVVAVGSAERQERYVRNMVALYRVDVGLALAIDAVSEGAMPEGEETRDGRFTTKVEVGGKWVYLHSRYRPGAEARAWAEGVKIEEKYVVVINGFGLGYHVQAMWEKLPGEGLIIVSEPDVRLLKLAFCAGDYAEMIESGRVMFFTSLARGEMVERLEPRSAIMTSGMVLSAHPVSVQKNGEFHSAFNKLITEFVSFTRTGFLTLMLNNVATCRNIANNMGRYVTAAPIDLMENAYRGFPAVLVAAGPSLAKNMPLLHKVKGKGVIIAVQTMLKPLLAAGIEPDFVTSLDYNTVSTRFFEGLEEAGGAGEVHLVAEPKAHWNVLDVFGGTMSVLGNDFAGKLLRNAFPKRAGLKAGATVAHLSFYLAEYLGCDPIVLTGQDLGFVDGLYYKPGTAIHETWGPELGRFNTLETKEWERIARSKAILRKIPDIHGHPMYTEEQFFVYLQQFERDFAASKCRVIDATEGGARKENVELMTLAEVVEKFCVGDLRGVDRPWKRWGGECGMRNAECGREEKVRVLEVCKGALGKRMESARAMMETCDATVPLLEEMIEKQEDEAEMRRLFVAVDRLRSRVGADPETFEMVVHLNTIGELRKFQMELAVKAAKEGSLERQKRQLLRDIDYVKNLKIGCERLIEIVGVAVGRLEGQMEAVRAGKKWPCAAAGGV